MPCGAVLFGLAEGALVSLWRYRDFASAWEIQWGIANLLPAWLVIASVVGVASAWLTLGALAPRQTQRWLAAAGAAVLAFWLGYELTHGRHFEVWWRRVGFISVLVVTALGGVYLGGAWLRRALSTQPKRVVAVAAGGAGLGWLANAFVLVRLYPAFHWGLGVLSLAGAAIAALAYAVSRTTTWEPARVSQLAKRGVTRLGIALSLALLLLVPASRKLSGFDNFRWIVSERAPLLAEAIGLAAWIAPPKALAAEDPTEPTTESGQLPSLELEGRDILLITVDALRADHVGVYGYGRPTTPNVDRLAAEGVRFERAYCATPHTSYSVTSLLTGKYMRPLLLQGLGADSETWADLMRRYGYRTAAFYPPAVFFIDTERFAPFDERQLGFEYQKREFLEGDARVAQVADYLDDLPPEQRVFVWLHLFGPHEPYEQHPEFKFGESDVDRYDSEIRATDETIGKVVERFRRRSPDGIVIVTADHGEEFGDHGGRYHGSSVYEEQVRVPLIVSAPGLPVRSVEAPVQTVDLLPTVLSALNIPMRPRIRGRNLSRWLATAEPEPGQLGFAFSETDEQTMLAEGTHRLICLRRVGACQLFDVARDPAQTQDVSREQPEMFGRLRDQLRRFNSEHGQFEISGARAEGLRWPGAILRGLAGDVDAAQEIAALLDDADVQVRRKAAEVLFELSAPPIPKPAAPPAATRVLSEVATPLRLALQRDEDHDVRAYSALALTRLGEGASLTRELLESGDVHWRRRAALALAAAGDRRGMHELLGWWMDHTPKPFETSVQLVDAFARAKTKDAVWSLTQALPDVRLRPYIVGALGQIDDDSAINPLLSQFRREPYHDNRTLLATVLLGLGAGPELAVPLRRWLGVGEPLKDGLALAMRAKVLEHVGGPSSNDLRRLRQNINLGQMVQVVVPKTGNGTGIRMIARVTNAGDAVSSLRVAVPQQGVFSFDSEGKLKTSRRIPEMDPAKQVTLSVPPTVEPIEVHGLVPEVMGLRPGRSSYVVAFAEHGVSIEALAFVPLQDEVQSGAPDSTDP
jgi:arylsulfatase A-like enzyme